MNQGDLLGVLKDSRPHMPLVTQLMFAYHVADGMDYLSRDMYVCVSVTCVCMCVCPSRVCVCMLCVCCMYRIRTSFSLYSQLNLRP